MKIAAVLRRNSTIRALSIATFVSFGLAACQPLYSSQDGSVVGKNNALSAISVTDVNTREAQQVRNHLIFLLSGGATPVNSLYELKLRVTSTTKTLATGIRETNGASIGNTAGSVEIAASYELYDKTSKSVIHRGQRNARASFDKTSQSFANERAERDAQNRAAKALAEQLRLAIASDLGQS